MIRGCCFTPDGRYVYLLASRVRYKTFLVQYSITPQYDKFEFNAVSVTDVHEHASTGMCMSPDASYISIMTSDGWIKTVDASTKKMLISQKRHNLPVTCTSFFAPDGSTPSHVISGSADYTYNLIPLPRDSTIWNMLTHLLMVIFVQVPVMLVIIVYLIGGN